MKEKRFLFRGESRITTAKNFRRLFACAKKSYSKNFSFYICRKDLATARLGVIVAKRNQKKAVCRNRIRRIIKESFRLNQHRLKGNDIIVMVKRGVDKISSDELRQELENKWHKISSR